MGTARIDNWYIVGAHLVGEISEHANQHEFKSKVQMTSRVVDANIEQGWVLTETGTVYELGVRKYA